MNGAAAASSTANAAVAERTAATAQEVVIVGASDAKDASVQIGWARR